MAATHRNAGLDRDFEKPSDVNGRRVEARRDAASGFDVRELPEVAQAGELGLNVRAIEVAGVVLARKKIGPHEPWSDFEVSPLGRDVVEVRRDDDASGIDALRRVG